jgi:hypothetical protein
VGGEWEEGEKRGKGLLSNPLVDLGLKYEPTHISLYTLYDPPDRHHHGKGVADTYP